MKLMFEMFPVILFFVAFKMYGIYYATAVAIVASVLQIAYSYLKKCRVETVMWVGFFVILFFGGATLILRNELFIKWKPTILYWVFSAVIVAGRAIFKKNIIKDMLGKQVSLPENIWNTLNNSWAVFFMLIGAVNLFVVYRFTTEVWVNFKLFGIMGLMLVFVIAQSIVISRNMPTE